VANRSFKHFFFAGGGTGGHIYPNLAVADSISQLNKDAYITFFCSRREVDARVLSPTGYEFLPLPAVGFGLRPKQFAQFFGQLFSSYGFVKHIMAPVRHEAAVIGTGGFVTAPVVMAARALKIPVFLINVDGKPGKANRFLGRLAKRIFVQFEDSKKYFKGDQKSVTVTGCPLRKEFEALFSNRAVETASNNSFVDKLRSAGLEIQEGKKILLVTGASSGARNINEAMIQLLEQLKAFSGAWQVVHLTGQAEYARVQEAVQSEAGWYHAVDYWDDMAPLLGAADIVVGRAGAVSVAEYAAAGAATVCLPYPYHKDRHQYQNAEVLAKAGAAVIVEDRISEPRRTATELGIVLKDLMSDDRRRQAMRTAARRIGKTNAADEIAKIVLGS
jgi:UDP-N-acetylglucosamine--N-acetylmuramyl-(pentapeptide) pyrophosphoryl-undecaprenol N-acetylglucosamine transferase